MKHRKTVQVCLSPLEELPEVDVWLVVDIIRASSVVVTFFDEGGQVVVPAETLEQARSFRREAGAGWLLMGERNAVPPEGFDLGNSPRDLLGGIPRKYEGAVMTTSNGTRAWLKAFSRGGRVLCAAARNAVAAAKAAVSGCASTGVLCAGKDGRAAMDDAVCAGLLVAEFLRQSPDILLDDGAKIALALWESLGGDLAKGVRMASHMGMLKRLGMEADVDFCCERDTSRVVPEMSIHRGRPAFFAGKGEGN
ncbi:MAG: 2-phosphosulfolactate phosphatase [Thermovirgaceae bacterium]